MRTERSPIDIITSSVLEFQEGWGQEYGMTDHDEGRRRCGRVLRSLRRMADHGGIAKTELTVVLVVS